MELKSYCFRGGNEPLIGSDIYSYLSQVARKFPESEAVVSVFQGQRRTYAQFFQEVDALARGLYGLGLRKGDRVGIWSTNNLEWILLQVATARIGAVLVNINPAYRTSEVTHALRAARVNTLFLIPAFRKSNYQEMILELIPELNAGGAEAFCSGTFPELRQVVLYDPDQPNQTRAPAPGFLTWQDLLAIGNTTTEEQLLALSQELDMDDPINIQFTSGTTGFAKPVVLTHQNILNNAYFTAGVMNFTEKDRLCIPVPFYHCFGMVLSNLACLSRGATIVIPAPHFDAEAVLTAVEKEGCTALHGVPTMFVAELELPGFDQRDTSSLRTGIMAGAPCPPELMKRVIEKLGIREILIGYGQTEASPITHITRPSDSFDRRVNSVGVNLPYQECKIVDPRTNATLPRNHQGEICFRGYHVMKGYYEMEEASHEAIDASGWLHSGDLGVMDEDGYVKITGRLKDMVIRGGENLYPAEIEAYYMTHPKIAQVAVFGIPDPKWGEELCAWIQLHEGEKGEPEEFRSFAASGLAHFKVPRHVRLVQDFPMTVTGKIQKFRLREIMSEELLCV